MADKKTNLEKLEYFADLIEPIALIIADEDVVSMMKKGGAFRLVAVARAIKNHPAECEQICATIEGVPLDGYEIDEKVLISKLVDLLNQPILTDLFTPQARSEDGASSGSAMANTGDGAN